MMRIPGIACSLLLGATWATAQAPGSPLPAIELEDFAQIPIEDYSELYGRAVMLEFFAYWCGPCGAQVPHLNELKEEFEDRGLTILGVTDEGKSDTERWIASKKPAYGYAYDPGGKLARWFGVQGIPHAVLVNADGVVAWSGHPAGLTHEIIEGALVGALAKPLWKWQGAAKPVAAALQKGDYKKAMALAEGLAAKQAGAKAAKPDELEAAAVLEMIRARIAGHMTRVETAHAAGDYLKASTLSRDAARMFAGLPEAERAQALLAELAADKAIQTIVEGQAELAEVAAELEEVDKQKDVDKLRDKVKKIVKEHPGTIVEKQGNALLDELLALRSRLGAG